MAKLENRPSLQYLLFGAIGGLAGSVAMIGPKMASNIQLGVPYNVNWIVFGTVFGANQPYAFAAGVAAHLVTGVIVGLVFGILAGKIPRLGIGKFYKGFALGIVTGLIVFGVFFVPMLQNVLAPNLVQLMTEMKPSANADMIKQKMQDKLPAVMQTSLGFHVLFGAVLGTTTWVLLPAYKKSKP